MSVKSLGRNEDSKRNVIDDINYYELVCHGVKHVHFGWSDELVVAPYIVKEHTLIPLQWTHLCFVLAPRSGCRPGVIGFSGLAMMTRLLALTSPSSRCPTRVTQATRTVTINLSRQSVLSRLVDYVDVHTHVYVEGRSRNRIVLAQLLMLNLKPWLRITFDY